MTGLLKRVAWSLWLPWAATFGHAESWERQRANMIDAIAGDVRRTNCSKQCQLS